MGEAVILGVDGVSDFKALHSSRHNVEVQLDVLAMEGEDLRELSLSMRKANLEQLLRGPPDASSSTRSRAEPSVRTCSVGPGNSGSRGWSQNAWIGLTAVDARKIG